MTNQDDARTEAVAQPASGKLHERVAHVEGTQQQARRTRVEAELILDGDDRHAHRHAVGIADCSSTSQTLRLVAEQAVDQGRRRTTSWLSSCPRLPSSFQN
ncbi:hypothetical protein RM96_05440 [Cupriavidus sp. IDO]|nr:hypothetical protein RM96_05440 [Cupriavidus sp. IDO]